LDWIGLDFLFHHISIVAKKKKTPTVQSGVVVFEDNAFKPGFEPLKIEIR
jgi:hypothetical protein